MKQWHEFLAHLGAQITNYTVENFGDVKAELSAAANGDIIADLSHLGLLELHGEDVTTFLQGQVTNDVKLLNNSISHYTGYCTPKGRLLALFLAFEYRNHIHLQFNRGLVESISRRLKMYVLRSKVEIRDVSDSMIKIGLSGQNAATLLATIFNQVPQQPHDLVSLDNAAVIRLPGTTPRYEIFSDIEHAPDIWNALKQTCTPVGKQCWDWLEIQAGIPDIELKTQEEFVPQMVNLDSLSGISFKKGCYTGQEIVARTHYLGKVKRRTYLAHLAADQAPQPGDNLFGSGTTEPVGQIVRAAVAPHGGFDVLAELRNESVAAGTIHWPSLEGTPLSILDLPYPVE